VHGDIKGPNILVSGDHTAKLMDFGSSTLKQEYTLKFQSSSGQAAFTLRWAAPELLSIDEEADAKPTYEADIYALGMTFLEIMSGNVPYHEYKKDASVVPRITQHILPKRPDHGIPKGDIRADQLWLLMQDTWARDPQYRPNARVVRDTMRMITARDQSQQQSAPFGETSAVRANAFEIAMAILPEVAKLVAVTRGLDTAFIDLPWQPVAMAISRGQHLKALEWLEQGRSAIWNLTFQPRPESVGPLLQHKLQQARDALYDASSRETYPEATGADSQGLETVKQKCQRLVEECKRLMDEILNTPDFMDSLYPRRAPDLVRAAQAGSIVMFNLTNLSCDALILTPERNEIRHAHLPSVSRAILARLRDNLPTFKNPNDIIRRKPSRPYVIHLDHGEPIHEAPQDPQEVETWGGLWEERYESVLGFLWSEIARPILRCLGYIDEPPTGELPRLTWCTAGELAYLPLHAAGYYDRPKCKVSDFVVSSYTPTLGALLSADTSSPASLPHSNILGIAPTYLSAGFPSNYMVAELNAISQHITRSISLSRIIGPGVNSESFLLGMEGSDWLHFCGHIQAKTDNPIQSYFQLDEERLTFDRIIRKSLKDKGLAFTSSCGEVVGDKEAVHLVSGMLMAGYRSVIGTMGQIADSDCPVVADKVYGFLLKRGRMDYRDSARALHAAVNHLRKEIGDDKFHRWVPFIHVGA
ncbi:hypothetical protein FRC11_011973, partial [Ceratobasidium sp. 423]